MKAITQYNNLMWVLMREHNTIGTKFSENTENWNLRDMVSEVQYTLDIYEDPTCIYWQEAHDPYQPAHKPWLKEWNQSRQRMKRFIAKYKDEAMTMNCTVDHSSIFD